MNEEHNFSFHKKPPFEAMHKAISQITEDLGYEYEKIREAPSFKEWFKDSKITNTNGNPLLVHNHGFIRKNEDQHMGNKFQNGSLATDGSEKGRGALGAYFTSSQESIDAIIDTYYESETEGQHVLTHAFLNIKNPLVVPQGTDISHMLDTMFPDSEITFEQMKQELQKQGYDGIVQKHRFGYYDDEYVAFSQDQIFILPGQINPALDLELRNINP
ncbi:MAG: hypothetical protein WCG20_03660 [bacterium]